MAELGENEGDGRLTRAAAVRRAEARATDGLPGGGSRHLGLFRGQLEREGTRRRYRRGTTLNPVPDEAWVFDAADTPRPAEERRAAAEADLREAFREAEADLHEALAHRAHVAWRLTRELARACGLLARDEPLSSLGDGDECWRVPVPRPPRDRGERDPRDAAGGRNLAELARKSALLPVDDQPHDLVVDGADLHGVEDDPDGDLGPRLLSGRGGFCLVPPAAPLRSVVDEDLRPGRGTVLAADYDPRGDKCLLLYVAALELAASYLGVERGSRLVPDLGRRGLAGLRDPELVRAAFPPPAALRRWEEHLVVWTLDVLVEKGQRGATTWLTDQFGLSAPERVDVLRMARGLALEQTEADVEEQRALMVLRLEDVAWRGREACDLRGELSAFKQLAQVQGLTRLEPEDDDRILAGLALAMDAEDEAGPRRVARAALVVDRRSLPASDDGDDD